MEALAYGIAVGSALQKAHRQTNRIHNAEGFALR